MKAKKMTAPANMYESSSEMLSVLPDTAAETVTGGLLIIWWEGKQTKSLNKPPLETYTSG